MKIPVHKAKIIKNESGLNYDHTSAQNFEVEINYTDTGDIIIPKSTMDWYMKQYTKEEAQLFAGIISNVYTTWLIEKLKKEENK